MAHQVRLHNSIIIIILITCFSCNAPDKQGHAALRFLNKEKSNTKFVNGLLMENSQPFSGTLFTLFTGTTDTAETSTYLTGKENGEWKKFYPSKKIREIRY